MHTIPVNTRHPNRYFKEVPAAVLKINLKLVVSFLGVTGLDLGDTEREGYDRFRPVTGEFH